MNFLWFLWFVCLVLMVWNYWGRKIGFCKHQWTCIDFDPYMITYEITCDHCGKRYHGYSNHEIVDEWKEQGAHHV